MCKLTVSIFVVILAVNCVSAQSTEFVYQGSLKDGASLANGNYDFEFALFDALTAGNQLGSTLSRPSIGVTNGSFSAKLDFGSQFPGANRFLEVRVRLTGQPNITTLAPRPQISNSPYAVRTLSAASADNATNAANATTSTNALQLGGVAANQYTLSTDPRLSDARAPTAGSGSYIQNSSFQQPANFNISGNGNIGGRLRVEGLQNGLAASFGGNGDFQIDANGIVGGRFVVLQNGNVGVGTAAPPSKLTVAGTIQSTSGGFKFPDGSVQTTAASPLYQGTNVSVNTGAITPGGTFTVIPGMTQTISVSGNAKLLIQFNVEAWAGSCAFCGASAAFIDVVLDNGATNRVEQDIANGASTVIHASWLLTVGPGSHTIDVRAQSIGPSVTFGVCCLPSTLIVQVIPQ